MPLNESVVINSLRTYASAVFCAVAESSPKSVLSRAKIFLVV